MANSECEGTFFKVGGEKLYCCFWDSSVINEPKAGENCPNCNRPIAGDRVGELEITVYRVVKLPDGRQVTLPPNV